MDGLWNKHHREPEIKAKTSKHCIQDKN